MMHTTPTYQPFVPHSIEDRDFWQRVQSDPATANVVRVINELADSAPARPPVPLASDYLAARRSNDRDRVDRYWRTDRITFSALVLRRCLLGIDPADPDDRLLDWLFSFTTHPTWVVSAHLPNNDLPASGSPQLDLAATEMAGVLAETVEIMRPWMDAHSQTLAESILTEIDRRVLEPFVHNSEGQFWATEDRSAHRNNWAGVCAGSILAACVSLERQGRPRPDARAKALRMLEIFYRDGFTPTGECDEGVMYWAYGVSYSIFGLHRLSPEDLARHLDLERLRQVASYPGRAHLFDDTFYCGNDSVSRARAGVAYVPWLAEVTGDPFLPWWLNTYPSEQWRDVMSGLRVIDSLLKGHASKKTTTAAPSPVQYLDDQQVLITRTATPSGELLVALGGGSNAERHNHNDVGHFIAHVNHQLIIPDLGAPEYTADFFGPKRYTYLAASSLGHCCPVINGQVQRNGPDTVAKVLSKSLTPGKASLELDLTAGYPSDAGLKQWTRGMRTDGEKVVISDTLRLRPQSAVTHLVWFTIEPQVTQSDNALTVRAGPLVCTLSPAPANYRIIPVDPAEHLLREFKAGETLYRLEADYDAPDGTPLSYSTTLATA